MTPFQALYGRLPPTIPPYVRHSTTVDSVDDILSHRDALLRYLKENLQRAQHRMEQKANRKRRELELSIGDRVLVRLQPYRQSTVANRSSNKLAKKYFGPFTVLERIGAVAYRLDLPHGSRIHPVFHISALKPFRRNEIVEHTPLPVDAINN